MAEEGPRKRRRIIIDDDEDEKEVNSEVGSNPDELLSHHSSEDEQGEDLDEHWMDDYAPAPELDYYDPTALAKDDDPELFESYEKVMQYRLAAEEELDALDARRRQRERESDYNLERSNRFDDQEEDDYDEIEAEDQDTGADRALNLEKFDCSLKQWIAEERTRREIFRRFKKFLLSYYEGIEIVQEWKKLNEGQPYPPNLKPKPPIYPDRIRSMCASNSASLLVSYNHIAKIQPLLAIWLTDVPKDMVQILNEVLKSVVSTEFPNYFNIVPHVHVRITDLPIDDKLRDLRQKDLNSLVKVAGVVTRRGGVFPQLIAVAYDCSLCGNTVGPWPVVGGSEIRPDLCPNCQGHGPFRVNNARTEYGNYQKLTLQETPGTVPAGRVPRYKDVIVLDDLIDIAKPGEEIEVTGIYCLAQQKLSRKNTGFPLFSTVIEANCIQKRSGGSSASWTEEDKRMILSLSRDPRIGERIIKSIAPSIYGHRHVKTAVALSLFGGCAKQGGSGAGSHRVRGDINVLLLGDPGTAKSQILKYSEKTAPRAVYTTGKGASAVGLTAGVHRDPTTKEWTLEGGALVLADQGVCLIDEFDKMNDQDRTSIHEAMEQQTISVSKAGIVTSLQARCSVIAAANPIGGRYDPSFNFSENVELTDPIIQRFDVLCVLQDIVDPVSDEKLARFVVASHMRSHPNRKVQDVEVNMDISEENKSEEEVITMYGADDFADLQPIEQSILKKYIAYARSNVRPILHDVDSEKIALLYSELRAQSDRTGGIPIAVRHIESIVRMSEASARMYLRDHVRRDDVDLAIKVVLESFVQAQKLAVRRVLQKSFRKYLTFGEDSNLLLMHQLQGLVLDVEKYKYLTKDTSNVTEVYVEALSSRAKELKVWDLQPFFRSALFRSSGFELDASRGVIRKYYMK